MSTASDHVASDLPWLSIVIPAYNEARRLPESLKNAREWLQGKSESCEVLVVDDGSTDATAEVVEKLAVGWLALRLVRGPHRGKGGAVREGILAARGEYIALADADFSMPVAEIDRLFASALDIGCDIAIGSREAQDARRFGEPGYRHLMGRVFNRVVQFLLPGIQDSQCGFKALRREVAVDVARRQTIEGWGFDVELLYIARRRGYTMREVGIDWYYMPDSRISPMRDTLTMLRDVLQIAWNARRGVYGGDTTGTVSRDRLAKLRDRLARVRDTVAVALLRGTAMSLHILGMLRHRLTVAKVRDRLALVRDRLHSAWNARRGVYAKDADDERDTSMQTPEETTAPLRDG